MPKVVKMPPGEPTDVPQSEPLPAPLPAPPRPPQIQPEADCIRIPPQLAKALAFVKEFGADEDVINAVKKHLNNIDVPEDLRILVKLLA